MLRQQANHPLLQRVQQGDCIEDLQVALKEVSADADAAKALATALENELEQVHLNFMALNKRKVNN